MEQETLFTSSKWDMLKCLESGKKSPLELAKEVNTSIANISQQLRLLELVGFVKSERISNRDKGQPRVIYSLINNFSYLVIASAGFVDKRFMKLDDYQKTILKIWFLEDKDLAYYLEKYFWSVEPLFNKVDFLCVDYEDHKLLKVHYISNASSSDLKKIFKDTIIDGARSEKQFVVSPIKESEIGKIKNCIVLYDSKNIQQKKA
jgi:predicted transcriptional regulator